MYYYILLHTITYFCILFRTISHHYIPLHIIMYHYILFYTIAYCHILLYAVVYCFILLYTITYYYMLMLLYTVVYCCIPLHTTGCGLAFCVATERPWVTQRCHLYRYLYRFILLYTVTYYYMLLYTVVYYCIPLHTIGCGLAFCVATERPWATQRCHLYRYLYHYLYCYLYRYLYCYLYAWVWTRLVDYPCADCRVHLERYMSGRWWLSGWLSATINALAVDTVEWPSSDLHTACLTAPVWKVYHH